MVEPIHHVLETPGRKTMKKNMDKVEGLKEIVGILRAYGAKRIILFGSFARGRSGEYSDIDIACEGVAPEDFFRALGEILSAVDRTVDLVDFKDVKGHLRNRIKRDGILLYEVH